MEKVSFCFSFYFNQCTQIFWESYIFWIKYLKSDHLEINQDMYHLFSEERARELG